MRCINLKRPTGPTFIALTLLVLVVSAASAQVPPLTYINALGVEAVLKNDGSAVITETYTLDARQSPRRMLKRCLNLKQRLLNDKEVTYEPQLGFVDARMVTVQQEDTTTQRCFSVSVEDGDFSEKRIFVLQYLVRGLIVSHEKFDSFLFPATGVWKVPIHQVTAALRLPPLMLASSAESQMRVYGPAEQPSTDRIQERRDEEKGEIAWELTGPLARGEEMLAALRLAKGFIR